MSPDANTAVESFWIYWKAEWFKTVLGIVTTTLGVFIGLFVNSYVDRHKEKVTFGAMLTVIRSEAETNKKILTESFEKYSQDGLVLAIFSADATKQYLADPLFTRHATIADLRTLYEYRRNLELANAYRSKAEPIVTNGGSDTLLYRLRVVWKDNLGKCRDSIESVLALDRE